MLRSAGAAVLGGLVLAAGSASWVAVMLLGDYDSRHTLWPHPPHWVLQTLAWAPAIAQLAYVIPLAKWAYRISGSAGRRGVWFGAGLFGVINVILATYVATAPPD